MHRETAYFLFDVPAGPRARKRALFAAVVSFLLFLALLPYAKIPLPAVFGFIPAYESALIVNDVITAILLLGQFTYLGLSRPWVLASGYLFTATMAAAHMATFPGIFSTRGLLGAGPQSTAWIYMFWHGGFPLFVIAYVAVGKRRFSWTGRWPIAGSIALGVTAAGLLAFAATAARFWLPDIMAGNAYTPTMPMVVGIVWTLSLVAFALLVRFALRTVLDLWVAATMLAWTFDIALSAVFNAGRFDVGFYAGRIYGFLAATFVLVTLLIENNVLYGLLSASHASERRERRRVEEKSVALQELNEQLDAFTHSVSHDLRAPLRAIRGFSEALDEDHGAHLGPEGRRLVGVIHSQAKRMDQLVVGLLAFSLLGRKPILTSKVDLRAKVISVIEELEDAIGDREIEFVVGDLGFVEGDPVVLRQAIFNLVGNAIKFTANCPGARIEIGELAGTEEPTFYVRDNGTGFEMGDQGGLFQPFQRFHKGDTYEGSGVGLSIVRRIVEKHGGKIWAESTPGRGSTFYFTLKRT